jgi:RND family efflux transporter MFP subunit
MSPSRSDLEQLRIHRPGDGAPSPFAHGAPERRVAGGRRGPLVALVVGLLVVVAAVAGWVATHQPPVVRVAPAEVTGGLSGGGGASAITANGYVVARTKASVAAKIAGRLAYLGVSEGSHVREGEIMARIEGQDVRAALEAARANEGEAKAQWEQAQSDLTRARELNTRGVLSTVDLENARTKENTLAAAWRSAAANAKLAAANVENLNVRAPFDGTVLRKDAEVGEIVAPSSAGGGLTRTAIVTMADLATLEVEVDVNEAYIARVTNGQPARITLDAYPDTSFAGRVRQVVPTADRQKATVLVKVAITDKDARILPEMGARVDFVPAGQSSEQAKEPRRVYAPAAAVVRQAGGVARVWTVGADDRVKAVTVTTGSTQDDRIEVKDGLTGDETLVLFPPARLSDGARIRRAPTAS